MLRENSRVKVSDVLMLVAIIVAFCLIIAAAAHAKKTETSRVTIPIHCIRGINWTKSCTNVDASHVTCDAVVLTVVCVDYTHSDSADVSVQAPGTITLLPPKLSTPTPTPSPLSPSTPAPSEPKEN